MSQLVRTLLMAGCLKEIYMKYSEKTQRQIDIASRGTASVLITGPTGSGKTHLARMIHARSPRAQRPFVTVNLASLHEGTLESELFGHERGAFTGAEQRRVGRLELAQGGTVFLDEIGELTPRLQARLLEFLQSRTITPVGGNRETKLDVRVIAATHRDLEAAIERGEFREDLFHRLRVVAVELRPIRERWGELDALVHGCIEEFARSAGRSVLRISAEVAEKLENYAWPGNIRELRNVLEYAVLAGEGSEITLADLPAWFGNTREKPAKAAAFSDGASMSLAPVPLNYDDAIANFERDYLQTMLERFHGRINYTARRIGMSKTTLLRRMRQYGLSISLEKGAASGSPVVRSETRAENGSNNTEWQVANAPRPELDCQGPKKN